jgi:hypothetical protein
MSGFDEECPLRCRSQTPAKAKHKTKRLANEAILRLKSRRAVGSGAVSSLDY